MKKSTADILLGLTAGTFALSCRKGGANKPSSWPARGVFNHMYFSEEEAKKAFDVGLLGWMRQRYGDRSFTDQRSYEDWSKAAKTIDWQKAWKQAGNMQTPGTDFYPENFTMEDWKRLKYPYDLWSYIHPPLLKEIKLHNPHLNEDEIRYFYENFHRHNSTLDEHKNHPRAAKFVDVEPDLQNGRFDKVTIYEEVKSTPEVSTRLPTSGFYLRMEKSIKRDENRLRSLELRFGKKPRVKKAKKEIEELRDLLKWKKKELRLTDPVHRTFTNSTKGREIGSMVIPKFEMPNLLYRWRKFSPSEVKKRERNAEIENQSFWNEYISKDNAFWTSTYDPKLDNYEPTIFDIGIEELLARDIQKERHNLELAHDPKHIETFKRRLDTLYKFKDALRNPDIIERYVPLDYTLDNVDYSGDNKYPTTKWLGLRQMR